MYDCVFDRVDTTYTFEQESEDVQQLCGREEVSADDGASLLQQGAMFGLDQGPSICGLSSEAAASVMAAAEGMHAVATAKAKAKSKSKNPGGTVQQQQNQQNPDGTEVLGRGDPPRVKTPLERAKEVVAELHKQASASMKMSQDCASMGIAPDLVQFMRSHQTNTMELYSKLQLKVMQEEANPKAYEGLLSTLG